MTRGGMVTTDLITRARAGDGDAFRELTEPHRRELQVHCYRMLGSLYENKADGIGAHKTKFLDNQYSCIYNHHERSRIDGAQRRVVTGQNHLDR